MGATIKGNVIYISKDLDSKLTNKERAIVKAHELGHYFHNDNMTIFFIVFLFFWCPPIVNAFKRWREREADRFALRITRDYASFVSLMDKLQHDKSTHTTKEARLKLAESMRGA